MGEKVREERKRTGKETVQYKGMSERKGER
jgi:hypothetical protein